MKPRAVPSARLRQAFLAWTVVLSLVMVWTSVQPRPSGFPLRAAAVGLAAVQTPDHVATLSAAGKIQRSAEFRHDGGPDLVALAFETVSCVPRIVPDAPIPAAHAPACHDRRTVPQPRAPPVA